MKINTHYDNLKVARDASPEDIKRAFRKLTFQHHPDRNPPEQKALQERRMRIIKEAYDVLSNPKLREEHDAWIKIQESNKNNKRKHEQKGEYDEENTYHHDRGRQEMYYKELLEKERAINLNLRTIKENLESELYKLNQLTQFLRNENSAHVKKNGELSTVVERLKLYIGTLVEAHDKELRKVTAVNKGLKWVAALLIVFLGAQFAHSVIYPKEFNDSVLTVLGDNLKNESRVIPPGWKIYDWNSEQFILSKGADGKQEFINIVSKGVLTKKSVIRELRGRRAGTSDCDNSNPTSPVNNGESVRYRFVQLENNTVLSVTVPYTHLCKQ